MLLSAVFALCCWTRCSLVLHVLQQQKSQPFCFSWASAGAMMEHDLTRTLWCLYDLYSDSSYAADYVPSPERNGHQSITRDWEPDESWMDDHRPVLFVAWPWPTWTYYGILFHCFQSNDLFELVKSQKNPMLSPVYQHNTLQSWFTHITTLQSIDHIDHIAHHIITSGWWFGTIYIFPYIGNVSIPTDFHNFQRVSNHQPVISSHDIFMESLCSPPAFRARRSLRGAGRGLHVRRQRGAFAARGSLRTD